jgi:hypothetical protein
MSIANSDTPRAEMPAPLPALERFTTQYSEVEDRIRIIGETSTQQQVVLWLTRRLLDRMVPALTRWLEKQGGVERRGEILQSMAQQAARAALDPQAPVQRRADTPNTLVHTVNMSPRAHGMEIVFRVDDAGTETGAVVTLQGRPLRQWLNIVYDQYCKAGWERSAWPSWIRDAQDARAAPPPEVVLH